MSWPDFVDDWVKVLDRAGITSESGASHYIDCVTPTGDHRRPPADTHTAKKVSQPSAMLRNSQVASSRREIPEITCFIVLFLFCKLSIASLLSPVATQWCNTDTVSVVKLHREGHDQSPECSKSRKYNEIYLLLAWFFRKFKRYYTVRKYLVPNY